MGDKLQFSGEGCVRTCQVQKGFCGAFCKKRPLVPAGTRRFFWELFFAPFVSKKSGVPNYALQNRCKPTEIKLSKPLVHFFFLKPKAQKEKVRKKKNAVLGSFAHCGERQGLCSLDSHPLAWGLLWVRCEHTPCRQTIIYRHKALNFVQKYVILFLRCEKCV